MVVYLHTLYVDDFSPHKMNENENLEQEMIISLEPYFTTVCEMTTQRNYLRLKDVVTGRTCYPQ